MKSIKFILMGMVVFLAACGGGTSTASSPTATVTMDSATGGVADGASGVSLVPSLVLKFSQAVEPATVNHTTITLTPESATSGDKVSLTSFVSNNNNTVFSFSPAMSLESNIHYLLHVKGVKVASASTFITGQFSFSTGTFAAPTVNLVSPTGDFPKSTKPTIQLKFSEAVSGVSNTTLELHQGSATGPQVLLGTINADATNTVYTFNPTTSLVDNTTYYIVIKAGIKSIANNITLSPIATLSFTTGDLTQPTVEMVSPTNNADSVALNPTIKILFSEPVTGVTPSNIILKDSNNNSVAITIAPDGAISPTNALYDITPSANLVPYTNYTLTLNSNIVDGSSNKLDATTFNFKTIYGFSQIILSGANVPPNGLYYAMHWMDDSGNVYIFGGQNSVSGGYVNDMYKYNIQTNTWTQITQSGDMPSPLTRAMTWRGKDGAFYLFGGWDGSIFSSKMYKFNPVENKWTELDPTGSTQPSARDAGMTWSDSAGNFYLFGGSVGSSSPLNDMYKYDPSTNIWTQLNADGAGDPVPTQRYSATTWSDSGGNFYLFGGSNGSALLATMYKYNVANNQWTQLPISEDIPPARYVAMGWTGMDGSFYLFGGVTSSGVTQDMYKFDRYTNKWQELDITATAPAARGAAVAFSDSLGNFYLYSGFTGTAVLTDMSQGRF